MKATHVMLAVAALATHSLTFAAAPAAPDEYTLTLSDGEYVDVAGTALQVKGGPISIQVWFKTGASRGQIFETGMENRSSNSPQAGYALYLHYPGRVKFGVNNSPKTFSYDLWDNARTERSYNDGQWHHVTCVFHGDAKTRVKIYMDGVEVPEKGLWRYKGNKAQPAFSSYSPTSPPSRIGAQTGRAVPLRMTCFEGELDEFRVWNIALSAAEIAENYRTRVPADTSGLVVQWSFDAGDARLKDAVGGHVGTLQKLPPPPTLAHNYSKYPGGLTGYSGYERNQIAHWTVKPAARQGVGEGIGERGLCEPAIALLADGTLVVCAGTWGAPERPLRFFRSTDRGANWAAQAHLIPRVSGRKPRLLCPDGQSLMLRVDEGRQVLWNGVRQSGEIYQSSDGGVYWARVQAPIRALPETPYRNASIARLDKDNMIAAVLADGDSPIPSVAPPRGLPKPENDRSGDHSVLIESSDGGAAWSAPRAFLGYSETDAHLLRLADGRILCTYHNMHVPFGIMAVFSSDNGKTWDKEHPVYLARAWGPAGGWPSSVQLDDGSIVTVYCLQAYRNEGLDTVVEAVRWQLPPKDGRPEAISGIEPLVDFRMSLHDLDNYPASIYGYSGDDRQQAAYLSLQPAHRASIGHRGLYKGTLAKLADDTLIAMPRILYMIKVFRSTDAAESWQLLDFPGFGGGEGEAAVLRDGTLLNLAGHQLHRSSDGGRLWETFKLECRLPDGRVITRGPVRNVVENDDGSLIMIFGEGTRRRSGEPPPARAWRTVSRDRGETWGEVQEIPVWQDSEDMFCETAMIRLRDGRILAASRVLNARLHGGKPPAILYPAPEYSEYADHMVLLESTDDGLTWSKPRDFLGYGRVQAHLLQLQDGRLLCSYTAYHLPLGFFAVLSEDQGKTWSTDRPIQLGIATGTSTGWPTSAQLDDGSIVTMYAANVYAGSKGTVSESVRWTLPPTTSAQ